MVVIFECMGFNKLISCGLSLGYLLVQVAIVMPGFFYRCLRIKPLINNRNPVSPPDYGRASALTGSKASVVCAILVQGRAGMRGKFSAGGNKAFNGDGI